MWAAATSHPRGFFARRRGARGGGNRRGRKAFISGADISRFGDERSTEQAVAHYNATVDQANAGFYEFPKRPSRMIRLLYRRRRPGWLPAATCGICSGNSRSRYAAKLGSGLQVRRLKRLSDLVGPAFAKEMFFTARQFDARKPAPWAWSNRSCPRWSSKLREELCRHDCGNAPLTVSSVKYIVGEVVRRRASATWRAPPSW